MKEIETTVVLCSSLSKKKVDMLKRCKSIPSFYISVTGWRWDSIINSAQYSIEVGFEIEENVLVMQTEKRFSELRKLYTEILSFFNHQQIPKFPQRRIFMNSDPDVIRERQLALNDFVMKVSTINGINMFSPFIRFFSLEKLQEKWNHYRVTQNTLFK